MASRHWLREQTRLMQRRRTKQLLRTRYAFPMSRSRSHPNWCRNRERASGQQLQGPRENSRKRRPLSSTKTIRCPAKQRTRSLLRPSKWPRYKNRRYRSRAVRLSCPTVEMKMTRLCRHQQCRAPKLARSPKNRFSRRGSSCLRKARRTRKTSRLWWSSCLRLRKRNRKLSRSARKTAICMNTTPAARARPARTAAKAKKKAARNRRIRARSCTKKKTHGPRAWIRWSTVPAMPDLTNMVRGRCIEGESKPRPQGGVVRLHHPLLSRLGLMHLISPRTPDLWPAAPANEHSLHAAESSLPPAASFDR